MTEPRSPEQLEQLRERAWDDYEDGDLRAFIAMDAVASEAIYQLRLALADKGADVIDLNARRPAQLSTVPGA